MRGEEELEEEQEEVETVGSSGKLKVTKSLLL